MPMPHQTWPAHAKKKPDRRRATTHIQAKYRLPGGSSVRRTSRLTSAKVGDGLWPSLIGSRVLPDDLPQIRDGWPRADLFEDVISPRRTGELGRVAPLVLQVAERDRLGRARLLAGRDDVAVPHGALLVARAVLAGDDALDAHRALLHHAELADGHVGVQLDFERRRELVLEPVEAPHVVRAVVAAVAGPDAAVVDLSVEAFVVAVGRVHWAAGLAGRDLAVQPGLEGAPEIVPEPGEAAEGVTAGVGAVGGSHRRGVDLSVEALVGAVGRVHWADRLAGRDLAVLAEHRQEEIRRMLGLAFRPALQPEPVQLTPVRGGGLPHHRDVVLRLACDHARLAADARVDVDRHAPARPWILLVVVHGGVRLGRRPAPEGLLAGGAQVDVLRQLAVVLIVRRLQDGERATRPELGERHLDAHEREAA